MVQRSDGWLELSFWLLAAFVVQAVATAQGAGNQEPIRYAGGVRVDLQVHVGRLRPAIGVASYQVLLANRTRPEIADGFGWTYNYAPMLAYWRGRFYLEYPSNPIGEHERPGQTLVVTSVDGRTRGKPFVVFAPYEGPKPIDVTAPAKSTGYMMHQRMAFFGASNGRLLACAFYGHAPNPFLAGRIGRVVREIYADGLPG